MRFPYLVTLRRKELKMAPVEGCAFVHSSLHLNNNTGQLYANTSKLVSTFQQLNQFDARRRCWKRIGNFETSTANVQSDNQRRRRGPSSASWLCATGFKQLCQRQRSTQLDAPTNAEAVLQAAALAPVYICLPFPFQVQFLMNRMLISCTVGDV